MAVPVPSLQKLADTNFALETAKSTAEFSYAIQIVSTALDGVAARLSDASQDEAKLKRLSAHLAELKSKKAE